jgi:hypothetical protein
MLNLFQLSLVNLVLMPSIRKYLLAATKTQETGTSVEGEVRWGTQAHDRALFSKTASAKAGFGCKRNVVDVHRGKQSKSE